MNLENQDKETLIKIIHYLSGALRVRQKQVNYWNLVYNLETNQISESEFEKTIDDNEDDYALDNYKKPDLEEFKFIIELAKSGLFGDEETINNDFYDLFELSEIYINEELLKEI